MSVCVFSIICVDFEADLDLVFSGNSIVVFVCRFSVISFFLCQLSWGHRPIYYSTLVTEGHNFLQRDGYFSFSMVPGQTLRSSAIFCWRSHGKSDRTCARKAVTLFFGWRQFESYWWPQAVYPSTIEKENYPSLYKKLWPSVTRVEQLIALGSNFGNFGMKKKCSTENRQKNGNWLKTRIRNRHQNRFQNWKKIKNCR